MRRFTVRPRATLIGCHDLTGLGHVVGDDPDGLHDLFVAVMIRGAGTSNGRGPRYTSAALSDARLPHVLKTTQSAVRAGELSRAYEQFTLRGVRRSCFTKWFAAVDDRADECERALILDDRVFRSLNALGWSSKEAAGTRRWPTRYGASSWSPCISGKIATNVWQMWCTASWGRLQFVEPDSADRPAKYL